MEFPNIWTDKWMSAMKRQDIIIRLEDKVHRLENIIDEKMPSWTNEKILELEKINKLNADKIKHLEDLNNISLIDVIKCRISKLFKPKFKIKIVKVLRDGEEVEFKERSK